ncbi:MBL fold metallo-hydrolase [Vibrio sp. DNB22_10_4]
MQRDFSVRVLGCGDAYDSQNHNSGLVVTEGDFDLLIDCGPWLTRSYLEAAESADELDAIYLTHTHPDHCLGLTTLLNWMDSMKRSKSLKIFVQQKQKSLIEPLIAFAPWPKTHLSFDVEFEFSDSLSHIGPWKVNTAPTEHAVSNLSLQIRGVTGTVLFFSGDGSLTEAGAILASESDWVFVECETLEVHPSHGSWRQVEGLTKKSGSRWRLYHIDPMERAVIAGALGSNYQVSIAHEQEILVAEHVPPIIELSA